MKIRTDFVTNSSSSSYCVEIDVAFKNNETASLRIDPEDSYIGGGGQALLVTKDQIFEIADINSLISYLTSNLWFEDADTFFEYAVPCPYCKTFAYTDVLVEKDEMYVCSECGKSFKTDFPLLENYTLQSIMEFVKNYDAGYFTEVAKDVEEFTNAIKKNATKMDDIQSIKINNHHYAYGEFSDLYEYLYRFGPSLPADKETALQILKEHLTASSSFDEIIECLEEEKEPRNIECDDVVTYNFDKKEKEKSLKINLMV